MRTSLGKIRSMIHIILIWVRRGLAGQFGIQTSSLEERTINWHLIHACRIIERETSWAMEPLQEVKCISFRCVQVPAEEQKSQSETILPSTKLTWPRNLCLPVSYSCNKHINHFHKEERAVLSLSSGGFRPSSVGPIALGRWDPREKPRARPCDCTPLMT